VLKKQIITIVLLSAYLLGLAHNVIPHCHEAFVLTKTDHQHIAGHHQHVANGQEHEDHEHVAHNDHQDESLIDYIICALSMGEEPAGEDQYSENVPTKNNIRWLDADQSVQFLVAVLYTVLQPQAVEENVVFGEIHQIAYESIDSIADPHRGPPALV
jgi:hypothetical protein